jgi:CHAD domain-containing protein
MSRQHIHDFRIATRQLIAVEELLQPPRSPRRGRIAARVTPAFDAAGKLRDAQLGTDRLRELRKTDPIAAQVAADLRRKLPRRARKLGAELAALDIERCRRDLRALRSSANGIRASRRLRAARAQLQAASKELPAVPTAADVHHLRLLVKRARYMQEWMTALPGAAPAPALLQELADLQTRLGEIADARALRRTIERWEPRRAEDTPAKDRLLRRVGQRLRRSDLFRAERFDRATRRSWPEPVRRAPRAGGHRR